MRGHLPRFLVLSMFSLLLTACGGGGGGGGGGTPSLGGGTGTGTTGGGAAGTPTLTIEILDSSGTATSNVSGNTPVTIRATLLDGSGDGISGTPVSFTSTVGQLTPGTGNVLTAAGGVATISLGAGTVADAGTASASATVDGVQISSNSLGIQSDGAGTGAGSATLLVNFAFTTADGSVTVTRSNPGTGTVTVTDGSGAPVSNAIVNFGTTAGVLNPASGSAATNASGIATVSVTAGQTAGSGILSASVTSNSETVDANPVNFITNGDAFSTLTLTIPAGGTTTSTSNASPVTVTATVIDDTGAPVQGAIVTFTKSNAGGSTDSGVLSTTIDITNASGIATTNLLPGTVLGPGTITASSTVNGAPVSSPADNTITFQSSGDGPFEGVGTSNLNIAIALLNGSGTAFSGSIDADNPGVLQATVTDATGSPLANSVVEFTTDGVGDIFPIGGSALTNASGIATVALNAGSTPGAGQATATLIIDGGRFNSESLTFNTLGNAGDADIVVSLTFTDATPGNGTNIITVNDDATVGILVEDTAGNNLPNRTATITTSLGSAQVGTGTAASTITAVSDADGRISVNLTAGTTFGTGDFVVIVGDSTASVQFTVGIAGLQIGTCSGGSSATDCTSTGASRTGFTAPLGTAANGALSIAQSPLSAGGTSSVSVVVLDSTGAPVKDIDISFTSNCVGINDAASGNPLSSITQTVSSLANGVATATYQDDEGCARTDIITATEASTGATATGNIEVLAAQIGAIVFDQVTLPDGVTETDNIFIRESGGTSTARVGFQVLDVFGQAAPDQTVSFSLTSTVGDISLQNAQGLTDSEGNVAAIVSAGFIATTVRVRASLDVDTDNDGDNTDFSTNGAATLVTLSGQLSINTGIADQNSLSLSASELSFSGGNRDGETVTLTTRLADRFNNPVAGTAVQFRSEYGTIEPSCTTTASGACTVTLTSSSPRSPLDPNVSNLSLSGTNCPSSYINEETVTITGGVGNTQYFASSIVRVETTGDALVPATDYTTSANGITCTAVSCSGQASLKVSYFRSFPDEDANGTTTHTITNPGVGTAPFRSDVQDGVPPCRTGSVAQGGTFSSGYVGGLGQRSGARSTVLAFAQGEESFVDSNGNGLYDFNEPFVDLEEAFVDQNEDSVFGNGTPATDDSRDASNRTCYGPSAPLSSTASPGNCFQIGGEEEEVIDFNENGKFDAGNGVYNGTLCPLEISNRTDTCDNNADPCDEATERYCTRDLVSINADSTIIFASSTIAISFREPSTGELIDEVNLTDVADDTFESNSSVVNNAGATLAAGSTLNIGSGDTDVPRQTGDSVRLISGYSSVVVDIADVFNQPLPPGTSVTVATEANGCNIANNPGTTFGNSNSQGPRSITINLEPDTVPAANASGDITVTVTAPNEGGSATARFVCGY